MLKAQETVSISLTQCVPCNIHPPPLTQCVPCSIHLTHAQGAPFFLIVFETGCYIIWSVLELNIYWSLALNSWDYRCVLPHMACIPIIIYPLPPVL